MSRTNRTGEQVWKNAGQAQHPYIEITRGELERTTMFQGPYGHSNEPEYRILRLMIWQKPVDQFYHVPRANRAVIVLKELHWRIQQLGGLNSHEFAVFLFEKLNSGMRQRFQRCPESVFHLSRAVGNTPQLPVIAAEKRDDSIGLSERICLQYNRIALMESHTECPIFRKARP